MYFDELDLNDKVLDALYDMRFDTCTPVQERCIPEILNGRDVLGVAQTGTGKTAAYLLPILSKLQDGGYPQDSTNCIVMSPTRELAQQIDQAMQGFAYYLDGVSSVAIYGGNDGNRYDQEMRGLSLGADVIIATPGRLISHMTMGNTDFSKVSFFVLDEADRMLDMGFSEDIMKIARTLPESCQTVMFSATMPEKIEELAKTLLKNPVEVKIAVSKPAEKIKQTAYICYEDQKIGIINEIFKHGDLKRVIIFSGKKQKVKMINRALARLNINSGEMHSDLDQAQRDEMMYKFKSGQIDVLVATDILSRGIDIDDISMVINFDVPRDAEDYVHRIGRTARADRDGAGITFVCEEDMTYFKQIEKLLGKPVEKAPLPEGLGEAPSGKRRDKRKKPAHADGKRGQHKGGENRSRQPEQRNKKDEGRKKPAERTETAQRPKPARPVKEEQKAVKETARPVKEAPAAVKEKAKPAEKEPQQGSRSNSRRRPNNRRRKPKPAQAQQQSRSAEARKPAGTGKAEAKEEGKIKSIISKSLKWLGLK